MLSRSVETQEHLVTESPREGELDEEDEEKGSGPSLLEGVAKGDVEVDDISLITLGQAGGADSSNADTTNTRGDSASKEVSKLATTAWAGDGKEGRTGVLNVAPGESDKNKDIKDSSSSETMPASVVNVGFDL